MSPQVLLERLVDFEQRVRRVYRAFGKRLDFLPQVRFFWNNMAEDERSHAAILQRSRAFLDLIEDAPQVSKEMLASVAEKVAHAEAVTQQDELTSDEAFRQALILESSELNSLDGAWFQSLRPALGSLLHAMAPAEEEHIRRLVEAVQTFSQDHTLQDQVADLWARCLPERAER